MKIIYSSIFYKRYKKLKEIEKESVTQTIRFFQENPKHPSLRNHALQGSMTGKRSISITDDLRIIFIEKGGYVQVLMIDVGDHDTVYFD